MHPSYAVDGASEPQNVTQRACILGSAGQPASPDYEAPRGRLTGGRDEGSALAPGA